MQWRKAYPESADRLDADGNVAWSCLEFYCVGILLRSPAGDGKICMGFRSEPVAVTAQKNLYGSLRVGRLGLLL